MPPTCWPRVSAVTISSVLMPNNRGTKGFWLEKHTKAPEGATTGAMAGGAISGTLGLLATIGVFAIPI